MGKNIAPGTWCIITGDLRISDEKWKQHYPQGIFGKVIERKGAMYMLRTYCRKMPGIRVEKHPHLKTHAKYLKQL